MTEFCFKCQKELGKFTFQKYPPKNLEFEGKTIPQNMTNNDVVCQNCYNFLSSTEKQKKYEKIMEKVLVIEFVIITALVSYSAVTPYLNTIIR
jgi:hypothetical protein